MGCQGPTRPPVFVPSEFLRQNNHEPYVERDEDLCAFPTGRAPGGFDLNLTVLLDTKPEPPINPAMRFDGASASGARGPDGAAQGPRR